MMTEEVLFFVSKNGVGTILLNRPKALNALSFTMIQEIHATLKNWATDINVKVVVIKGAGQRGLCAGGDIKALYEARNSDIHLQEMKDFFTLEYQTDLAVAEFPKPLIAVLDGIVMGGGVGLTYGASTKIVTERTNWAMPEMTIGFFTDVGAAYFLNKAPGFIGRYLALTATQLNAADVLYINGANHFMPHDKLATFLQELEEIELGQANLKALQLKYASCPEEPGNLASLQKEIDTYFSHTTVEEILYSLDKNDTIFAQKTKEIMLSKSPVSLKVTLKQLIDGEQKTLAECLTTDLILTKNFMQHEDFFEGVRSVVIDKDFKPNYTYKDLSAVSDEMVNQFFREQ